MAAAAATEPFKLSELSALIDECLHEASSTNEWSQDAEECTAAEEVGDPVKAIIGRMIDDCWTECSKEAGVADLLHRVDELNVKAKEVDNIFVSCFAALDELKKSDVGAVEVSISSDSSDDDVQFISTSFDPTKAKQQQEKQQQKKQQQQQQQQQQLQHLQQLQQQQQQQQLQRAQQYQPILPQQQQQHQQHQPQLPPPTPTQQIMQQQTGILTKPQLQQLVAAPGALSLLGSGQLSFSTVNNGSGGVSFQYMSQDMQQLQPRMSLAPAVPITAAQGSIMRRPTMPLRPAQNIPMPPAKLVVGMKIFAKKHTEIWYKGAIVEITNDDKPKPDRRYKVKFDMKGVKTCPGKLLAMTEPPTEMLPVGTRIIALYRAEEEEQRAYYAGVVAEPPSLRNNNRYLTFFDDGYAQYCRHTEVHRVFEQSRNVWDDIHPDSQEFIRGYLQQYPERPMVRLQKGQIVRTEWKGKWWVAKVTEVDASLVKMYFEADHRVEWIYRGSTRLEPLYTELANQEASKLAGKGRRHNLMKRDRRPVVEYYTGMDDPGGDSKSQKETPVVPGKRTPVARKSTAQKKHRVPELLAEKKVSSSPDIEELDDDDSSSANSMGGVRVGIGGTGSGQGERKGVAASLLTAPRARPAFSRHACGPACVTRGPVSDDPTKFRGSNPLLIPQLCGWERQLCRARGYGLSLRRSVSYRAPCGRRLRSIDELDRYLQLTRSNLTPDLFSFDAVVHTDTEYVPVKTFCDIKDLSYGKETVPISCVNGIDRQYPDYVEYSNQRIPAKGVSLNLNTDYLVGCGCTDGCRDRSKCACIQRTLEASKSSHAGRPNDNAPYHHRRIQDHVVTGIYECNSKCKCNCSCTNRVAQNGLSLRLQVFKTEKRGWGLRCLDDIPCGGFICIYAGQLLTEQGANEDGQQYGDEYLAELDYIEVVERNKEGYESDVDMPDDSDEDEYKAEEDSDRSATKEDRRKKSPATAEKTVGAAIVISDDEASNQSTTSSTNSTKKTDEHTGDTRRTEEGIAGLVITEPTSLNVDNEDSDSDDAAKKEDQRVRRSARAAAQSRFSNLPDPKQQQDKHKKDKETEKKTFKSTRHYFGEEFCYVMDAKSMGNLGRYLNHSCSPNVFVQNVFVDTHDLRFPWVAFFAGQFIRAGTELTWDYNYEVGSVPGKILYCYCGSAECRGRLL